jgi:hypothetical protein
MVADIPYPKTNIATQPIIAATPLMSRTRVATANALRGNSEKLKLMNRQPPLIFELQEVVRMWLEDFWSGR